jgi:hypothetical protein
MIYLPLLACFLSLDLWANPFPLQPLHIRLLWYLNVHMPPPYRWQRCQAVLYPNMLLLSWIAQGGGHGFVTLDLLNFIYSIAWLIHESFRLSHQNIRGKLESRIRTRFPRFIPPVDSCEYPYLPMSDQVSDMVSIYMLTFFSR